MKEKIMSKLPLIYTYYTIIILVTCIYNLILGNNLIEIQWFVEVLGGLVAFSILDLFIDKINFKSFIGASLTESLIGYLLFLAISYFFQWVPFTLDGTIHFSVIYIIIIIIGISYFYYRNKMQANELNQLIQNRNK